MQTRPNLDFHIYLAAFFYRSKHIKHRIVLRYDRSRCPFTDKIPNRIWRFGQYIRVRSEAKRFNV
jgi:hypothetical protein